MSRPKQRSIGARPRQLAGYSGGKRTPTTDAAVRRALTAGPRGASLGLDEVPGVAKVRIVDHGAEGVTMPVGQAHVEVWGGDPHAVFASVVRHSTPGVTMSIRWRPAGRWVRWLEAARWWLWRVFVDRRSR